MSSAFEPLRACCPRARPCIASTVCLHSCALALSFTLALHTCRHTSACLSLRPADFDYITRLREANERAEAGRGQKMRRAESFVTVDLVGHLFDTGIIGQLLDAIEDSATSAHIVDFRVGKDRTTPTELRLQLFTPSPAVNTGLPAPSPTAAAAAAADSLARTLGYIRDVAAAKGVEVKVEGEETYIHSAVGVAKTVPRSLAAPAKRILVLGSGYVSAPLVDYLLRRDSNHVTLASMILPEAVALAGGRHRVSPVHLDVGKVRDSIGRAAAAGWCACLLAWLLGCTLAACAWACLLIIMVIPDCCFYCYCCCYMHRIGRRGPFVLVFYHWHRIGRLAQGYVNPALERTAQIGAYIDRIVRSMSARRLQGCCLRVIWWESARCCGRGSWALRCDTSPGPQGRGSSGGAAPGCCA